VEGPTALASVEGLVQGLMVDVSFPATHGSGWPLA
jgi:hypothetical protein